MVKKEFFGEEKTTAADAKAAVKAARKAAREANRAARQTRTPRSVETVKITIPRNPRAAFELGRMLASHNV